MSWGICCTVGSTAGIAQPKFLFHILEGPTSRYSEKYMAYKIGRVTLGGVKKKHVGCRERRPATGTTVSALRFCGNFVL